MRIGNNYTILAIETSCDETSAAVSKGRRILSNTIWSQIKEHQPWGGVVPDIARREHKKHLPKVIAQAFKQASANAKRFNLTEKDFDWSDIDAVAVTYGPGLAIALEVGIKKAKELSQEKNKPLIGVSHMEGHLLSSFALNINGNGPLKNNKIEFPCLGLLISGGHTQLVLMKDFGQYEIIGETLDDAAGEAYDKVAKMLDLGYPGGPIIEQLAKEGDPNRFDLPIPMARHKSLNFSFSGLKTACLYKLKKIPDDKKDQQFFKDFAASFQRSLIKSILINLKQAIKKYPPKQLFLGGGVINNISLRKQIRLTAKNYSVPVSIPYSDKLLSDNAGMIAVAGFYSAQRDNFVKNISDLDRNPNLSL